MTGVTVCKSPRRPKVRGGGRVARWSVCGALIVGGILGTLTSARGAQTFTAYSHTGVITPRGLTAVGKYVWISDYGNTNSGKIGSDAKVVRLDVATGVTRYAKSPFISLPSNVVASRRYAWVMNNTLGKPQEWSLLRINAATMVVSRLKIPATAPSGLGYVGDPILLAGRYVWIPCARGIIRVNTATLVTTTITSPFIFGSPSYVVSDAHYLWMNAPTTGNGVFPKFLVRISVQTGVVTKVSFPGVGFGYPIGDDGTSIWLMDKQGIQRVNTATRRATTIAVPKEVQISTPSTGPSAVANGAIYFCAGATGQPHPGLVRIGINSGLATVVSSAQFDYPDYVTAENGNVWVLNTYGGTSGHALLVRVS
jgi:hypothetical protein